MSENKEFKTRAFGSRFKIGVIETFFIISKNIFSNRPLIWQLFKRDLLTANKRSYLGFFWSIFAPVFAIISWLIIQMAGVLNPGDTGVSFPVYVLSGTLIYGFFNLFIESSRNILVSGAGFISQIEYNHEVLWGYNLVARLFWYLISVVLNILVLIFLGVSPKMEWLLLPFLLIPMFFLGSSIGFLLLVFDKAIPDFSKIIDIALPFLYWITPIIYAVSTVKNPYIYSAIKVNPLYYLSVLPRDIFLFGTSDLWGPFLIITSLLFIIFLISIRFYYVMEEVLVERL